MLQTSTHEDYRRDADECNAGDALEHGSLDFLGEEGAGGGGEDAGGGQGEAGGEVCHALGGVGGSCRARGDGGGREHSAGDTCGAVCGGEGCEAQPA